MIGSLDTGHGVFLSTYDSITNPVVRRFSAFDCQNLVFDDHHLGCSKSLIMPVLPLIGIGHKRVRAISFTVQPRILTAPLKITQETVNAELQPPSNMNPWKEIERTVRTEERVKDCTEDIDTLLVFVRWVSRIL